MIRSPKKPRVDPTGPLSPKRPTGHPDRASPGPPPGFFEDRSLDNTSSDEAAEDRNLQVTDMMGDADEITDQVRQKLYAYLMELIEQGVDVDPMSVSM